MLKKLFAHEWKDTWKLMTIFNAAMLLIALSGLIFFNARNVERIFESSAESQSVALVIGYMSYIFLYAVGIGVLSFGTMLYFFIRFYRNLYTDQGYLMHTLPVSGHQLILSKTFVAVIWRLISSIICVISVMILFLGMLDRPISEMFKDMSEDLTITGPEGILLLLLLFIGCIGGICFQTMMGYLAISIGQQVAKNKVLASIGVYIGMQVALNIISNIITQSFMFSMIYTQDRTGRVFEEPSMGVILLVILIADLLIFAISYGLYVLVHYFMKKKLNLD